MRTAVSSPGTSGAHCPGCSSPAGPGAPHCRCCGIWLAGPQAAELRWIAGELRRVDAARTWLISRRAVLLGELARLPGQAPAVGFARAAEEARAQVDQRREVPAREPATPQMIRRPEMSGRTAARLLLGAGATLVVIAVTIFTVADWARIGPLGRSAILLGATALVLAAPRPLIRRHLNATAEAVAAIGLALTIGDAYLFQRLITAPAGALLTAAFCAALAAAWAAYGMGTGLQGPRLAAICLAQLPAPLAIAGMALVFGGPGAPIAGPVAVGLVLTSGADVLAAGFSHRRARHAESAVVSVAAVGAWTCGVLVAATASAIAARRPDAPWLAAAFAAAAVVGIAVPGHGAKLTTLARPAAVLSGALAVFSLVIPVAAAPPASWDLALLAACGFGVSIVALTLGRLAGKPAGQRLELAAAGSAATLAAAGLLAAPVALVGLFGWHRLLPVWTGYGPRTGIAAGLSGLPGLPAAAAALALVGLGCLLTRLVPPASASAKSGVVAGSAGLVAAALAAGSVPAAAHLTGWAALITLAGAAAAFLSVSTLLNDKVLAGVAAGNGGALAAGAALWSLAAPKATIAVLAVLTAIFFLAALRARHVFTAALSTAGLLAAATGAAWAIPLAGGWPARYAAFAALGVAIAAVAAATALQQVRPVHSVVLDLGAGLVIALCAIVAAGQQNTFAMLAVTVAVVASGTAWLRAGPRRAAAVVAAASAAIATLATQWQPIGHALAALGYVITHPWQGHDQTHAAASSPGLSFAVVVLAICLAALAATVGAWQGSGRASLDAVAVALPLVAAPAGADGLATGIGYWAVNAALVTLAMALTAWAALGRSAAPAGAALLAGAMALAWALAAPVPTLVVLGCLTVAYACCAWRARLAGIRVAAGCLTVLAAAALAWCATLATDRPNWQAGLAALGVAACAQVAAAGWARERCAVRLHASGSAVRPPADPAPNAAEVGAPGRGQRAMIGLGIEITAWLVTVAGVGPCLRRPSTACLALATAGVICLGVSARAARRPAIWPGLALCYLAWCLGLLAAGVAVLEAYTGPAAALAIIMGWQASRREPQPHSWLAYGPGLSLLLLPSLIVAWQSHGWIRPVLVGLAAAAIAIAGARARMQAPLLTGAIVAVLDSGRGLAPAFARLVHELPGWVPVAALGAALLWAGATYEGRLRNLNAIRRTLAAMS
jgi:hypothetical protein